MIKKFRLSRPVSTVPVKLFKGEDETLMERVESAKRQRKDELRQLSAARTCRALVDFDTTQAIEGRLLQGIQRDNAERVKTPRQQRDEQWQREDQQKARETSKANMAAQAINPFVTPNGSHGVVFGNAEEALSFRATGFR